MAKTNPNKAAVQKAMNAKVKTLWSKAKEHKVDTGLDVPDGTYVGQLQKTMYGVMQGNGYPWFQFHIVLESEDEDIDGQKAIKSHFLNPPSEKSTKSHQDRVDDFSADCQRFKKDPEEYESPTDLMDELAEEQPHVRIRVKNDPTGQYEPSIWIVGIFDPEEEEDGDNEESDDDDEEERPTKKAAKKSKKVEEEEVDEEETDEEAEEEADEEEEEKPARRSTKSSKKKVEEEEESEDEEEYQDEEDAEEEADEEEETPPKKGAKKPAAASSKSGSTLKKGAKVLYGIKGAKPSEWSITAVKTNGKVDLKRVSDGRLAKDVDPTDLK